MKILSLWSLALLLALTACHRQPQRSFQGYVEGEFVEVATSEPGRLERLSAIKGTAVEVGAPLFSLEAQAEAAGLRQAQAQLAAARAQLQDLEIGKRPQELAVIRAQLDQAQAESERAVAEHERDTLQLAAGGIAQAQLDRSQATAAAARARVLELERQEVVATLPARDDQIAAQKAQVSAAQAALEQAAWRLGQKTVSAPVAGLVFDTLYRPGEWVAAGRPVIRLLPPENIKLRCFVPETVVGRLTIGQALQFRCSGRANDIPAEISYISLEAEFTPPIIYSQETRSKLVFMVEARTLAEADLHPGQPVEIIFP